MCVRVSSARQGGKMRRERNTFHTTSNRRQQQQDDADDTAPPPPDLPTSFTLPVSGNLPKFDFAVTARSASSASRRPEFITSSPIGQDNGAGTSSAAAAAVSPAVPFTFSSPIAAHNNSNSMVTSSRDKSQVSDVVV